MEEFRQYKKGNRMMKEQLGNQEKMKVNMESIHVEMQDLRKNNQEGEGENLLKKFRSRMRIGES